MAPEQVRGAEVSVQTDIWGMGVVFYECLSGRRPFERDSASATAVAIASDPPRALAESAPGLPDLAYEIAARCLRKLPAERFESARSLGAAFGALGDGAPRTTPPPAPDSVPTLADGPTDAALPVGDLSTPAHSKTNAPSDARTRRAYGSAASLIVALVLALAGLAYWQARAATDRAERASPAGPATPSPAIVQVPETPERAPALPAYSAARSAPPETTASAGLRPPPLRQSSTPLATSASPPASPAAVTSSRLAADPDF
jgi:serine/threonine-protein kinase